MPSEEGGLKQIADALAALTAAERDQLVRSIDGPPRPETVKTPAEYVPLPTSGTADRWQVTTRIVPAP
jgi:hypothetical protein